MARTGRRKGSPDTREAILAAAREAFAQRGFDGASVRGIATSAGVDPALVYHYFATKEDLFLAVVGAPTDPGVFISEAVAGDQSEMGERLVRTFVSVWGDPKLGPALLALVRSGIAHDWSARMLREFAATQILRRIVAKLDLPPDEAKTRSALVASQMLGLGMARYLMKIEPLASMESESVVRLIAPTVQRYLTGPL
jgi:AcrR family transcriptional regulator